MPDQSSGNVMAAFKRETTMGVAAASGGGAHQLPLVDSPGIGLSRGTIESGRRRRDKVRPVGRLGTKAVEGSFNSELLPGGAVDMLLESTARGTWSAVLAPAAVSVTNTTSVITRATGSFITDGYRVGDVITLTGDTTTANNNRRLRIASLTATAITLTGTPLVAAGTARSVTITRLKKVIAPAVPIYHSYTIEQYDEDIDASELFLGNRLISLAISMRPNSVVTSAWTFMGLDREILTTVQSPYFTAPSELNGLSLVADDSWIRYKGQDVALITGLDLTFAVSASTTPTIGGSRVSDVFMNDLTITGSVTAIRNSLEALTDFDSETMFELHVTLKEPIGDPAPMIGIFLPSVKVMSIEAPFLGSEGAKVETRNISAGPHAGSATQDATALAFYSSAT
jgi:hypothetical protein